MMRYGSYHYKQLSYIRNVITFEAPSMMQIAERKCKKTVAQLLKKTAVHQQFSKKVQAFYAKITAMQSKFSNLKVRRDAKFTMLRKHWDNTLAWLDQKGEETGNAEIKMVSAKILMVDTMI